MHREWPVGLNQVRYGLQAVARARNELRNDSERGRDEERELDVFSEE